MRRKEFAKQIKRILVFVIIFSMLQSYLITLSDFAGVAYAAIATSIDEESKASSSVEDDTSEFVSEDKNDLDEKLTNEVEEDEFSTEATTETKEDDMNQNLVNSKNDKNNHLNSTQKAENVIEEENNFDENDEKVENEIVFENTIVDDSNDLNQDDNVVENIITSDEIEEDEEEEEVIESEELITLVKILENYKTLDGLVLKAEISSNVTNLKDVILSSKDVIRLPVLEGYTIEKVYLTGDMITEESEGYIADITNNEIIIDVNNEEKPVEHYTREYIVTIVYTGFSEVENYEFNYSTSIVYENLEGIVLESFVKSDVNIQDIIENEYELNSQNMSIYKGYLYANAVSTESYETKYTSIDKVKINSLDNIDRIIVTEDVDVIENKNGIEDISLMNLSAYKTTKINKTSFDKVFGNKGYIEVFSDGKALGRIDSKTKVENDYYVYEYEAQVSEVEFRLNEISSIGDFEIINNKVIKKTTAFDRSQIMNFSNIKTKVDIKEITVIEDLEKVLFEDEKILDITLEETESRMDLAMNLDSLSTSIENEVTFTITLRTDEEKYELFKNPEIIIELPSDITDVEIENINLLYKNGLSVEKFEVVDGEFGKKLIKVKLVGTQIEYTPGLLNNGTTINLLTKIKLNRLTTNKESNIKFKYTNEIDSKLAYENEGKECVDIPVKFVSKFGLLRVLSLENQITKEIAESYDIDVTELKLEKDTVNQVIKYKGAIVNNFEDTLTNVQVVGRIPTEGKQEGKIDDLESTFSTILNSKIITSGSVTEVYYSEDPVADKNSDTWVKEADDLSKVKSYKLVLTNPEMKQGEKVEFSFDIKIPDNMESNEYAYAIFNAYYDLDEQTLIGNCTTKLATEKEEIKIEDIPEEDKKEIANLVVGTVATQWQNQLTEEDTVYERQALEYTIVVTNNSAVEAKNVKIKANAENANLYYFKTWIEKDYQETPEYEVGIYEEDQNGSKPYEEFSIDVLKPNETRIFKYQVIVKSLEEISGPKVYGKIIVSGDNFVEQQIETVKNEIVSADFKVLTKYATTENEQDTVIYSLAPLRLQFDYKNISDETIRNAKLKLFISDELELNKNAPIEGAQDYEHTITEVSEGTIIEITIPEAEVNKDNSVFIYAVAKDFNKNLTTTEANAYAVMEYDNKEYYSNNYVRSVQQMKTTVNYTWTADKPEGTILKDEDKITYTLKLENVGKVNIQELSAAMDIDSGLKLEKVVITDANGTTELDGTKYKNTILSQVGLNVSETAELKYTYVVDRLLLELNQKTIEMRADISSTRIDDFSTNVISYEVEGAIKDELVESVEDKDEDEDKNNNNQNENNLNNNDNNKVDKQPNNENNIDNNNSNNAENNKVKDNKKYKVSGKVWLDRNKDGIYTTDENGIGKVGVAIYGVDQDGMDLNKSYGNVKTSEDGTYEFKNIPAGKYVVTFGYDLSLYTTTTYKSPKAKSNENSDAISKDIFEKNQNMGVTDIIEVKDGFITDIDMGLIQLNDFDMSLQKYISKTIVRNSKGTTEQKYEQDKLVKLEIHSKVFESSEVEVVYNFVVKNEGDLNGYVNKIVDYIPDGLEFNKEKNEDWTTLKDGTICYTGLIDKSIKPGDKREFKLVLTANMDNPRAMTIINTAELSEVTNEKGFEDIDSIIGNKAEYEDDYGKVGLLITVSTGKLINYGLIIIASLLIIAALIVARLLFIKKNYK